MVMRTYGLSGSGMDVDQMVKDLMKAKRTQYNTLYKKKTQLEWKKADYNTVYKSLSDFRNTVFNNKLQSTLSPRKVASNNSAVSATASAGTANITHNIEVSRLASGVQEASSSTITTGTSKDTLAKQFNMEGGTFSLTISNGSTSANIIVDPTQSIYDLASNINKAGVNVVASYDASVDRFYLATASTGANAGIDFSGSSAIGLDFVTNKLKLSTTSAISPDGISSSAAVDTATVFNGVAGKFDIQVTNGGGTKTVNIDLTTDTLNTIAAKMSDTSQGVQASYDSVTGKFNVSSTNGSVSITGGAGVASNFISDMQLATSDGGLSFTSSAALFTKPEETKLSDLFAGLSGTFNLKMTNGSTTKTINIDTSVDTLNTLKSKIIGAAGINATVNYDATTRKFTIGASSGTLDFTGSDLAGLEFINKRLRINNTTAITPQTSVTSYSEMFADAGDKAVYNQFSNLSGGTFTIRVKNGSNPQEAITVDTSVNTLDDVIAALNAKMGPGTAAYDSVTGKVTLKAPAAGSLDFSGSDAAALDFLANKLNLKVVSQKGQDAALKLDGADINQASNTFTVAGVTYTLNSTTEAGKSASVVVTPDIDKTIDTVKKFVEEYNKVLGSINSELTEAKYKDYLPLTDDEKSAMSDDQVKTWEEKAKSGLLRRNPILSDLMTKMRTSFVDAIGGLTGNYKTASSIGIDTSLGDYKEGGKLYVNENKLRTALNADPDIVYKIFGTDGLTSSQDGVAVRLSDNLKSAVDKIVSEAGITASTTYDTKSNLAKEIKDYNKRMDVMNSRLQDAEARYYKQFDAMETALNKMNQQNSWLIQQFSSK